MTVENYGNRFEQLVQYVPHYQYSEEEKAKRFIRELQTELSSYLVTHSVTTYHEAVQRASLVEWRDYGTDQDHPDFR